MYLITNREINTKKKGLDIFGKKPNTNGAQEITIVEVEKRQGMDDKTRYGQAFCGNGERTQEKI